MTLKRLMVVIGVLVLLLGIGIAWLWQYAYSPEGRARVIIAQLKGDTTSLRGWLLKHQLVRPGYSVAPLDEGEFPILETKSKPSLQSPAKDGTEVGPIGSSASHRDA